MHADGVPLGDAVGGLDQHPGDGVGAVLTADDAHLVVDQVEPREAGVERLQRLPHRVVQRVDRTVALTGRDDPLTLGVQLDGRLRHDLAAAALDDHPPGLQPEEVRALAHLLAQQQLEAGLGRLEAVAHRLEVLHPVDDPQDRVAVRLEPERPALQLDRRAAGQLGDQQAHVVADDRRVDVLVEVGVGLDGADVQPGLVREGAAPDPRLVGVGRDVGDLGHGVRHPTQLDQPAGRQHLPTRLDLERGDDAEQVGVAATLAVAVGRALHVGRPDVDRGERVGHRAQAVSLWAWMPTRRPVPTTAPTMSASRYGSMPPLVSQSTSTSAPASAATVSTLHRVHRIREVAVEEVLGVQEHPLSFGREVRDAVADHREVLLAGGARRARST